MLEENWLDQMAARRFTPLQRSVLLRFRTEFCPLHACDCLSAHSFAELRRSPCDLLRIDLTYRPQLCQKIDCEQDCRRCHGVTELNFHPLRYKTLPCLNPECHKATELCPYQHQNQSCEPLPRKQVNMNKFKTSLCPQVGTPHDKKICFHYHGQKDRRRSLQSLYYSVEACPANCQRENCRFSHNSIEELFHPDKYKKRMCGRPGTCSFGAFCAFAHQQNELRIKLIHKQLQHEDFYPLYYKTEWCPYDHKSATQMCSYAHSFADYRRSPASFKYNPSPCKMWRRGEENSCPKRLACQFSHGQFQSQFHPKKLKKSKKSSSSRSTSQGGRELTAGQAVLSSSTRESDYGAPVERENKWTVAKQTLKGSKLLKTTLQKGGKLEWLYGQKATIFPQMLLRLDGF